jgi:erythrin-vacuolar iron transport family protein
MIITDLTEQQLLALAIANEEEDARIYHAFAVNLRESYPASAKVFEGMAGEETGHRTKLYDLYRVKFGEFLPLIRRQDVKGFIKRKPLWLTQNLSLNATRAESASMEQEAANYYRKAASQVRDVSIRQMLVELAEAEEQHSDTALALAEAHLTDESKNFEAENARKKLVLTYVQPGLAGLMDGSVSTLAPLFAAAFATQNSWETFVVGLAASVGAGISMGLTEALSDDGIISGRGSPWIRGWVTGIMTLLGGLGHTIPYLLPFGFWGVTSVAFAVVLVELIAIAWIRWKYMETSFVKATLQIVLGGVLVVLAGIYLGKL